MTTVTRIDATTLLIVTATPEGERRVTTRCCDSVQADIEMIRSGLPSGWKLALPQKGQGFTRPIRLPGDGGGVVGAERINERARGGTLYGPETKVVFEVIDGRHRLIKAEGIALERASELLSAGFLGLAADVQDVADAERWRRRRYKF